MAEYLNPLNDKFILKGVISGIGNILDYINPFSENFILKGVLAFFNDILSYINPFSDNFLGYKLVDLLKNLFIMTKEQEQAYKAKENSVNDIIESKFGIFYFFKEEIQKANEYVHNDDFLKIQFSSWHCDLGIVKFDTPNFDFTTIRDLYEPYRVSIRYSLFVLFVGLAIVYLIKYVLNYSVTGSDVNKVMGGGKNNDS